MSFWPPVRKPLRSAVVAVLLLAMIGMGDTTLGPSGAPAAGPGEPIKLEDLPREADKFLQRYNEFLRCCATDPSYLEEAQDLEQRAAHILRVAETGLSSGQVKTKFRQVLLPVEQAQKDLQDLRERLRRLIEAEHRSADLTYEEAGRLRRSMQEEREGIRQGFQPASPPPPDRTGAGIEDTTLPSRTGPGIGDSDLDR